MGPIDFLQVLSYTSSRLGPPPPFRIHVIGFLAHSRLLFPVIPRNPARGVSSAQTPVVYIYMYYIPMRITTFDKPDVWTRLLRRGLSRDDFPPKSRPSGSVSTTVAQCYKLSFIIVIILFHALSRILLRASTVDVLSSPPHLHAISLSQHPSRRLCPFFALAKLPLAIFLIQPPPLRTPIRHVHTSCSQLLPIAMTGFSSLTPTHFRSGWNL